MYTMLVVSSVLFFQSSRNTLAMAPKTGSANEGRRIENKEFTQHQLQPL